MHRPFGLTLDLPHHHDIALCSGLLVGHGHHFWVDPSCLAQVSWDWVLAGEAPALLAMRFPSRLLACLPIGSSPTLEAS